MAMGAMRTAVGVLWMRSERIMETAMMTASSSQMGISPANMTTNAAIEAVPPVA